MNFDLLQKKLGSFLEEFLPRTLEIKQKERGELVTSLDISLSDFTKTFFSELLDGGHSFYSEEDHPDTLSFPAVILDPIDGTAELVKGSHECCYSLAIMKNASEGEAFIFNPFTGLCIHSGQFFYPSRVKRNSLSAMISRSEYSKKLHHNFPGANYSPKGSIAFKLGLLAAGACDFVLTQRPKNIWDIAAGTLLCSQRRIQAWQLTGHSHDKLTLDQVWYKGPLLWCHEDDLENIIKGNS